MTDQVSFVDRTGGNQKPVGAIRRFEHKMVQATIPQLDSGFLQRLGLKLADRNAVTAVQQAGYVVLQA